MGAPRELLGRSLGVPEGALGLPGASQEGPWGASGGPWGSQGSSCGALGGPEGVLGSVFRRSRSFLKSLKNHWFFHYFQHLGRSGEALGGL